MTKHIKNGQGVESVPLALITTGTEREVAFEINMAMFASESELELPVRLSIREWLSVMHAMQNSTKKATDHS